MPLVTTTGAAQVQTPSIQHDVRMTRSIDVAVGRDRAQVVGLHRPCAGSRSSVDQRGSAWSLTKGRSMATELPSQRGRTEGAGRALLPRAGVGFRGISACACWSARTAGTPGVAAGDCGALANRRRQ